MNKKEVLKRTTAFLAALSFLMTTSNQSSTPSTLPYSDYTELRVGSPAAECSSQKHFSQNGHYRSYGPYEPPHSQNAPSDIPQHHHQGYIDSSSYTS